MLVPLALLILGLSLSVVSSASASATLTANQPDPVVGEIITYTGTPNGECPSPITYTYSVDGVVKKASTDFHTWGTFTYVYDTAGPHTVSFAATGAGNCTIGTASLTDTVGDAPGGTITTAPEP